MFIKEVQTQNYLKLTTGFSYACALVLGTFFLTLSAKINIPCWPVHMTMQTFAVIFLSILYGQNLALATVSAYILEGLLGLPVFQSSLTGMAALMSPSGGYIVRFLLAAAVIGTLSDRGFGKSGLSALGLFTLGALIIDIPGLTWLSGWIGFDKACQFWLSYQISFALKTSLGGFLFYVFQAGKIKA